MTTLSAALVIVVLVGIAVFVLLFEKRRAQQITRDLRDARKPDQDETRPPPDD